MATKKVKIVRYKPPNELIGAREFSVEDFKRVGILTQKKPLVFNRESNFWLNAEEAEISAEALKFLEDNKNHTGTGTFTVEEQTVEVEDEAPKPSQK